MYSKAFPGDLEQLHPLLKEAVAVGQGVPHNITPASEMLSQDPFMNLLVSEVKQHPYTQITIANCYLPHTKFMQYQV